MLTVDFAFTILSPRTAYGPLMRLLGHIGSMIINVRRDNAALRRAGLERSGPGREPSL